MDWKAQLGIWLDGLSRYVRRGKTTSDHPNWELVDDEPDHLRVRIYTVTHRYFISAGPDYLGCIASTRAPRPGEDWTRGNDLADGKFNHETWVSILTDIVAYELQPVVIPQTAVQDTPESVATPS